MLMIRCDVAIAGADQVIIDREDRVWNLFFGDTKKPPVVDLSRFTPDQLFELNLAMKAMVGGE